MKLGDMEIPVYRDVNDKQYVVWEDIRLALGPQTTELLKAWLDRNYDKSAETSVPVEVLRQYLARNRRF